MRKIEEEIDRLVATLQAMTERRMYCLRHGNLNGEQQIQSVQVDIDAKIQELKAKKELQEKS